VASAGKLQELRERGAEFTAAREAVATAAQLPIVRASAPERARFGALNIRAQKLQSAIEAIGKTVDGARRWFSDTFSLDMASEIPLAGTAIDVTIQSAIAGMNYFIRDAKAELSRIGELQKIFESQSDEQKKNMLGDLRQLSLPALPAPSGKTWLIVGAVLGLLFFLNSKGGDDGKAI
jgi:hypothetical protein